MRDKVRYQRTFQMPKRNPWDPRREDEDEPRCGNCPHWQKDPPPSPHPAEGRCRKSAPKVKEKQEGYAGFAWWLRTDEYDYCGEHPEILDRLAPAESSTVEETLRAVRDLTRALTPPKPKPQPKPKVRRKKKQ